MLHPKSKATMTLEEMLQMERKRKKKQKYDDEEHRIQCSCVKWFNLKYPKLKGRLFAVPNGGRRDTVTGGKLKAEGVTAGVSDLILLKSNRDYGALLIEMKKKGGYSYHGKSILIDDDLSVIGSFNMDMRSTYLDTELMLVIRSKEINKQLEEGMMEYERVSRQVLEDGTYRDPYHVEPIELTKKRQRKIFLVQHLLGWARYLF